jgi:hypothetical protein
MRKSLKSINQNDEVKEDEMARACGMEGDRKS